MRDCVLWARFLTNGFDDQTKRMTNRHPEKKSIIIEGGLSRYRKIIGSLGLCVVYRFLWVKKKKQAGGGGFFLFFLFCIPFYFVGRLLTVPTTNGKFGVLFLGLRERVFSYIFFV